jgi:serine/threonine protein kinase
MPFYTKRMVRYLEGKDGHKKKKKDKDSGKALRVAPSGISGAAGSKAGSAAVPQNEVLTTAAVEVIPDKTFDEKKLLFMKSMLKASVERINKEKGPFPVKHRYFRRYTIQQEEPPVFESPICKIFKAKHQDFADNVLAAKVYEGDHGLTADCLQFKVLRTLGKKHPQIIQTWDLFHNAETNQMYVMQELANRGSLDKHLEANPCDEQQAGKWLSQILKALDYLGDVGISHRSLQPKHVLLTHKDLRAKISGFANSVIYWDPTKEDIKNCPCLALDTRPTDAPTYQAPEVYGDPSKEEFDPIVADVWSLGATFYYMFTKAYPYDFASADANAVSQIQPNVDQIQGLSAEGKKLLAEMLKPMAVERKHIDKLTTDPFVKKFK